MMQHPGHILIVDDNELNRRLLTRALAEQGYTSATAEHGRHALELLRAKPADGMPAFDVVLLDILMPELDGLATLKQMKADAALRDLPVIIISALDETESAIRCIELGAEDYLPKPFNPVLLRARIGASLEKKRLRDQEHEYLRGLERELEIGRQIQASFLPAQLPQTPGWEISAIFKPAREVAGDFYDVFPVGDQIGLVVADVCDKGVGAALFMALFRSLLRALAQQNFARGSSRVATRLIHTLTQTNTYIVETHGQANMFATIFFGVLDPHTGMLTYANAGHEAPLVLNRARVKAKLERTGMVLGILPGASWRARTTQLAVGDTLFAFTDGIVDAVDANRAQFSHARLLELAQHPTKTAHSLLERVESDLNAHIAGAPQFDDVTMLAVRRHAHRRARTRRTND